jgi:hypothetical protein
LLDSLLQEYQITTFSSKAKELLLTRCLCP